MTTTSTTRRWQVLTLLASAFFMTVLDSTIVVTALPSIGADLGLPSTELQWVVTGYVVAFGGLLLFSGRLADLLGRRLMFVIGNVLWILSSATCGLAGTGEILIAGRVMQGVAAAVIAPAALSLLMVTFPDGPERNKALGIWGGLGGVGATAGLLLGGVITNAAGWPWIFFVNIPVGLVVLALSPRLLQPSKANVQSGRFDVLGAITVTAAAALLVFAITTIPEHGFGGRTIAFFVAAVVAAGLFVVVERRVAAPLVPFRVLRSRVLVGGNLVIFAAGMAVDGMLITLTSFVQGVLGWSSLQFGLLAAAMTVMSVVGVMVGQRAVSTRGLRPVAVIGGAMLGIGCLLLAFAPTVDVMLSLLVAGMLVFGAGMGAAFVAGQVAALTGAPESDSGLAAGLADTSFSLGSGVGVAIAVSVLAGYAGTVATPSLAALTMAHRLGFGVAAIFAVAGVVAALVLLRRPRTDVDAAAPVNHAPVPVS